MHGHCGGGGHFGGHSCGHHAGHHSGHQAGTHHGYAASGSHSSGGSSLTPFIYVHGSQGRPIKGRPSVWKALGAVLFVAMMLGLVVAVVSNI